MEHDDQGKASQGYKIGGLIILSLVLTGLIVFLFAIRHGLGVAPSVFGFGPYDTTLRGARATTAWDWLDLLIVPAALGLGALWLNYNQKRTEMTLAEKARNLELEIAQDRQRQGALDQYLDKMSDLLLNHGLRWPHLDHAEEGTIARARTVAVLRMLDADRKTQLFRFLEESGLIAPPNPVIWLEGSNLMGASMVRANLAGARLGKVDFSAADLTEADLTEADLSEACLVGTKLSRANLSGANLFKAEMSGANLTGVNLQGAKQSGVNLQEALLAGANLAGADLTWAQLIGTELIWAELTGAELTGADLTNADLTNANLSAADLNGAVVLGTKLVDAKYTVETRWPDGFDPIAAGAVLVAAPN